MLEEYLAGAGPRVGALRLAEEPRRRAARQREHAAARWRCAAPSTAVRLPALPRLRRVRGPAPAAPQGARRGAAPRRRPARARQRRQAVARRHPRDRVHRAAAAGRARRPVSRDAHALDAEGARQARRGRPDEAGQRRSGWPRPTPSCAGSSTASSTSTTSRPTCCRPPTPTWRWIARSLGLACDADACELLDRLGEMREFVATEFDALLHDGRAPAAAAQRRRRLPRLRHAAAAGGQRGASSSSCRRSWRRACGRCCEQPKIADAARRQQAAPGAPGRARRAGA